MKALLDGDQIQAIAEARRLRDMGVEHERIVTEGIEVAMGAIGRQVHDGAVQLAGNHACRTGSDGSHERALSIG